MKYLEAVYALNFLLEGVVHKAVLFHHRNPFKCLARNGDRIERPTATYTHNKT